MATAAEEARFAANGGNRNPVRFVIVRDARRVAPANEADVIEARSAHDTAVRLRKRRAKAKAARQQRKRNR